MKALQFNLETIYLDWFNNYISPATMAMDYGVDTDTMIRIIELARDVYTMAYNHKEDVPNVTW